MSARAGSGYLRGRIDSALLAQQLFGAQRLPRQDWVSGYIDLATYRQRALIGMLLTFAADATPELRAHLRGGGSISGWISARPSSDLIALLSAIEQRLGTVSE